ncbi:glucosaminidase domain-containing protein [Craterilacuibacter sp. RT1T]|uniref:glycoside hydrolase family 73 protein n=1 Tax=Craterilacuibacter sp. RT1T TaxID=2942211 RepID=UPI0020C060C4|nr:glucosaminidase domain-containing protein [Craterilacuibacter sp. RT1T]MCL6262492.1 glucosaminidase domain-containing protein [Craterilacuibacter sp. RT1T]
MSKHYLFVAAAAFLSACSSHTPPALPGRLVPVQLFAQTMLPHAAPAARQLGVAPEVIVAHAALESGWGMRPIRHPDGSDSHNLFSLKATPSWQGETVSILTTEFIRGRKLKRVERFRAYPSFGAAFSDYASLLGGLSRYEAVRGVGPDARAFACGLKQGGYATDPAYVGKLIRVTDSLRQVLPEAESGV